MARDERCACWEVGFRPGSSSHILSIKEAWQVLSWGRQANRVWVAPPFDCRETCAKHGHIVEGGFVPMYKPSLLMSKYRVFGQGGIQAPRRASREQRIGSARLDM